MNVQSAEAMPQDVAERERRAEILRAAANVFAKDGFRGATLKRIASAARISPGLVYWYFKDKEALFNAVIGAVIDSVIPDSLHRQAEAGAPPEQVLEDFARRYLTLLSRSELPSLPLLAEVSRHDVLRLAMLKAGPGRVIHVLGDYLRQLHNQGVIVVEDPDLAVEMFMGMCGSQIVFDRLMPGLRPARDPGTVARAIAQTFINGLRTSPPGGGL